MSRRQKAWAPACPFPLSVMTPSTRSALKSLLGGVAWLLFAVAGLAFWIGGRAISEIYQVDRILAEMEGMALAVVTGALGSGRFMVRRTTIRKRMRAKLREVKQQLRQRMHDPVPQTGQWLKSVVQGYFNYYAVPGNLASLGVFRDRVLALWWRTLRRRIQKRRISWTRILVLAHRWFPQPRALHPSNSRYGGAILRPLDHQKSRRQALRHPSMGQNSTAFSD